MIINPDLGTPAPETELGHTLHIRFHHWLNYQAVAAIWLNQVPNGLWWQVHHTMDWPESQKEPMPLPWELPQTPETDRLFARFSYMVAKKEVAQMLKKYRSLVTKKQSATKWRIIYEQEGDLQDAKYAARDEKMYEQEILRCHEYFGPHPSWGSPETYRYFIERQHFFYRFLKLAQASPNNKLFFSNELDQICHSCQPTATNKTTHCLEEHPLQPDKNRDLDISQLFTEVLLTQPNSDKQFSANYQDGRLQKMTMPIKTMFDKETMNSLSSRWQERQRLYSPF